MAPAANERCNDAHAGMMSTKRAVSNTRSIHVEEYSLGAGESAHEGNACVVRRFRGPSLACHSAARQAAPMRASTGAPSLAILGARKPLDRIWPADAVGRLRGRLCE